MNSQGNIPETDALVVGAGPVGLTAAIALAGANVRTVLVGPRAPEDHRTTALLASSVRAFEALGVWDRARAFAAPLREMRLIDDTRRLLRAPEARFAATEIGLDAFGHNIENRHLLAVLEARAAELPALTWIRDEAEAVRPGDAFVALVLKGGRSVTARILIGADGRRSMSRRSAGIETEGWRYPQTALTCNVAHTRPHHDISTEFHTETGPFTVVPLPNQRSSIVCVVDPATAERLFSIDDAALAEELERRSHSILGKVSPEAGRGRFPLAVETAQRFAANRIALAGEAAHTIPPIGAQGLNLGLRDAATISELVIATCRSGGDPGSGDLLARYDALRRADIGSRTFAVDLLNSSLLSSFLPVQGVRGLGLYLLNRVGPLRRAAMRAGVAPDAQPHLMRGHEPERGFGAPQC